MSKTGQVKELIFILILEGWKEPPYQEMNGENLGNEREVQGRLNIVIKWKS